jgi:hypothetical protein
LADKHPLQEEAHQASPLPLMRVPKPAHAALDNLKLDLFKFFFILGDVCLHIALFKIGVLLLVFT